MFKTFEFKINKYLLLLVTNLHVEVDGSLLGEVKHLL